MIRVSFLPSSSPDFWAQGQQVAFCVIAGATLEVWGLPSSSQPKLHAGLFRHLKKSWPSLVS